MRMVMRLLGIKKITKKLAGAGKEFRFHSKRDGNTAMDDVELNNDTN